ncbi:MAG: transporter [Ignavibacteria bacterium]|nr:transporter [Ignavibacteria bacterium]
MEEGEKCGLIGKNGAGKTSLLRIIAGTVPPDEGEVVFNSKIRLEFLEQLPDYTSSSSIIDTVLSGKSELLDKLELHRMLCVELQHNSSNEIKTQIEKISSEIEIQNGWQLENEAKKILSKLGVNNYFDKMGTLSGGLRKRVALARALLAEPDFLILDEPTNHLDADSVQWLQDRLSSSNSTILFVTHDRYFLDALSTRIIELDSKKIYSYSGNYEKYLLQKENFLQTQESTQKHLRNKLRTELVWLSKGAKARRSKQKSRIDWITDLQEDAQSTDEKKIKIELGNVFLGSRLIDAHGISKSLGGKLLFKDFTYLAKPGDRIGIIGLNGSGKSSLLNVLSGELPNDSGTIKIGQTVKIGFFRQESTDLNLNISLVAALREVADYIDVGVGRDRYLTAKDLLNKFLFSPSQHSSFVSTLSGGERRRLAILRVLMGNPNVLLLDEPTNDFDIPTLTAFEEYLDNFMGVLIIVSHDRAFLDRTVNFIWAFEEGGRIREYPGNYTDYLEKKEARQRLLFQASDKSKKTDYIRNDQQQDNRKKLSYKLQREFEELELSIPTLEEKKIEIESKIYSGSIIDYKEIEELSHELERISKEIEQKTERWFELSMI